MVAVVWSGRQMSSRGQMAGSERVSQTYQAHNQSHVCLITLYNLTGILHIVDVWKKMCIQNFFQEKETEAVFLTTF